jgi:hypothetical protein
MPGSMKDFVFNCRMVSERGISNDRLINYLEPKLV